MALLESQTELTTDRQVFSAPGGLNETQWASIREVFELFEQQSQQLQAAYQSLKQDLARSNEALQQRNVELVAKNQELSQMTSRLGSVIESMTDGLLVIGPDGRIERCNTSAEVLLGISRAEIEGAVFAKLIPFAAAHEAFERVLAGGVPMLDRSWTLTHPEGDVRSLLVSLAPMSQGRQAVLGAICNLRDVTELRCLERQLHSQERLAALGEMAASVAHEIRNPLGTIEGFARLLRRDLAAQPEPLRLASRIVEGAQNLNYVITNLLNYARPMHLHVTDATLERVFAQSRDTLGPRAMQVGVRLDMGEPSDQLVARVDERQLIQVLLNLGLNAIEACNSGEGRVRIDVHGGQQFLVLRVRDNGCGMTPEQVKKVFDPFFTMKEGGTGLGLSLTRKIIDAHGGDIGVESKPGEGTTMTVRLPRGSM